MSDAGSAPKKFYGKYRGLVLENLDPMQIGRIMAQVPDVLGETPSSWAMPCVPVAGIQAGAFMVPPVGSQVWMEFEQGNPDYPIWTGGFWGTMAEIPVLATVPPASPGGQNIVLQTSMQSTLVLSDSPPTPLTGGIVLKSGASMIVVNASGIYITAPIVAINQTALVVMGP
jgi:hypothetical protein